MNIENQLYNITGYMGFFFLIVSHFMLSIGKWKNNSFSYLIFNLGACATLLINSSIVLNYAFIFFNIINSLPVISTLLFNKVVTPIKNKIILSIFFILFSLLSINQMINNIDYELLDYIVTIIGTLTSFCFYLVFLLMMNNTIKTSQLVVFYMFFNSILLFNSLYFGYLFGAIPQGVFLFINIYAIYKHYVLKQSINLIGSETEMEIRKIN